MRVAVYGGSFNPPHVGHLLVAAWVRWTDQADEVWLLPSFSHPFAKASQPFDDRVAWCEAVIADEPGLRVCRIESELTPPSYTIDVMRALAARHPEHRFRFLLGADLIPKVDQWKEWASIVAEFEPIVVGRQGHREPLQPTIAFPPVSSTDIRARAAAGQPISHLVPAAILPDVKRAFGSPLLLQCSVFDDVPGVVHGFTGRAGGVDYARTVPGLDPRYDAGSVAWMTQVHGNAVVRVTAPSGPHVSVGEADGAFTTEPDVVLAVRTADCVPVLLAGPGVVGVVHAGWRGVASQVVAATVQGIELATGVSPPQLRAAIGPAISGAAYEVGGEVVEGLVAAGLGPHQFLVAGATERPHVDLQAAVRVQLEALGVRAIETVARCTAADPSLFSYRADGPDTGRQAGLIARREI